MASLGAIKHFVEEVVFPELVKDGMYSSFASVTEGRFDFSAHALLALKNGEYVRPSLFEEEERIQVVVCDRVFPGEMLEFDLGFLMDEVFSGAWYKENSANTILIVRKTLGLLNFSWIRLSDFIPRRYECGISINQLRYLRDMPPLDMTCLPGPPGEIFLRDAGRRDRLLLNYAEVFSDSCIREFTLSLDDERLGNVLSGWQGNCEMPGQQLQSRQELDERLKGSFDSIVGMFKNSSRGEFSLGNATKDPLYYAQDVFDRIVATAACLIKENERISQQQLIAKVSRMIAPIPMRRWVQDVAVQYQAMLEDELYHRQEEERAAALRDNSKPAFIDQVIKPLKAGTAKKIERLLKRAENASEEENLLKVVKLYGEAAVLGSVPALERLIELEEETGNPIVSYINDELSLVVMNDADRTFMQDCARKQFSDLQQDDVAKILQVANGHEVTHLAVERVINCLQDAYEALNDSAWMCPDGHDDGESIDTILGNNE